MQITDIRVKKIKTEGKLKAYVNVTFDGCFVIHNVKVIDGKNGIFIAMPSRKTKSGEYKDIVHPVTQEFRNQIKDEIIDAYDKAADSDTVDIEPDDLEDAKGDMISSIL